MKKTFQATAEFELYDTELFLAQHVGEAKDGDKVYRLSLSLTGGTLLVSLPGTSKTVAFRPEELLRVARLVESGELKIPE